MIPVYLLYNLKHKNIMANFIEIIDDNDSSLIVQPATTQPGKIHFFIREYSSLMTAMYLSPTQISELITYLQNCLTAKNRNTMKEPYNLPAIPMSLLNIKPKTVDLSKPLTPQELFALATLPPDICEAIQKLLIQNRTITMDQLPKSDGSWNANTIKQVFEHKGWKVSVDIPGYNEQYSTTLTFSY